MVNKMRPFLERIKSRKFLSALFSALFIVLNEGLGTPIDREAYAWITGVVISYIVGESFIDASAAKK